MTTIAEPSLRAEASADQQRSSLRAVIKALARGAALVLVTPLLCAFWLGARVVGRHRALLSSTQTLAWLPGITGQYLRRAFLRCVLEECHVTATVEFGTLFSHGGARLGARAYVGPYCQIGLAHIRDGAMLASGVQVPSGRYTHGIQEVARPMRDQPSQAVIVTIGANSWIGASAVVMADVGRDTVIGAGAVVTREIPDRVVACGVPARVLRHREEGL